MCHVSVCRAHGSRWHLGGEGQGTTLHCVAGEGCEVGVSIWFFPRTCLCDMMALVRRHWYVVFRKHHSMLVSAS